MATTTLPGGTFTMAGGPTVTRTGYGAMQLAGPGVFGPPKDHDGAIAVLRAVRELGITHIDTSDFYGPHVTNQLIREALAPYPAELSIVTKVGAFRDDQGGWVSATEPDQLRRGVEDNLRNLGVDALDVVNLRNPGGGPHGDIPLEGSIAERFGALVELQQQGKIKHLGLSNVTAEQITEAQGIAPIVGVQNLYNLAHREHDHLVDSLAGQGIAFVPYFPLGGFTPLQHDTLGKVAARLGASPMSVALAWLLQRSPNLLLIPGTSSVEHLHENVAGAGLSLSADDVRDLDAIA
jgi:pyridoxine 4-dehydrogenase